MNGKTIFIAGVYGTGKSTLCASLSTQLKIPFFSASDLISEINGEKYGAKKAVKNATENQRILAERVKTLNYKYPIILLAGHFCIFKSDLTIDILPDSVFKNLNLAKIILLESETEIVVSHLSIRDKKRYPEDAIAQLAQSEYQQSIKISELLSCPFSIYHMTFSSSDVSNVEKLIDMEV